MYSALSHDRTTITRLRLRGGQDPLATQLRLARDLNAATVHPPALPPNAILCVRRLTSRAPATHAYGQRTQWEPALAAALARCVQQAARPAFGPAPANAVAVLFADHAEMLACLAQSWLAGGDSTQWWWHTLFPIRDLTQTMSSAWLDAPEAAPAALEHLAHKAQAVAFVRALPTTTAATLLARIITTFGLYTLHSALYAPAAPASTTADHPPVVTAHATAAPPWQSALPDLNLHGLARDQAILLGVALMVRRAPAGVRTRDFATQVAQWRQHASPADDDPPRLPAMPSADREAQPLPLAPPSAHRASAATPPSPSRLRAMPIDQAQDAPPHAPAQPVASPLDAHTRRPAPPNTSSLPDQENNDARTARTAPRDSSIVREQGTSAPFMHRAAATTIDTEFGGLFYLINVGIYLELYADFTTPLTAGIDLDIFDFLALVGEAWLGASLRADPLWALLAELAGRSADEPPGAHFTPPNHEPLTAWLAAHLAMIEQRLHAALDLPAAGVEASALPHFLCAHPAEVAASATHLDIHLSLAGLPIAIRLSGLDRNPGWVPAAARVVTFYFD